jgi:hypothetical protein
VTTHVVEAAQGSFCCAYEQQRFPEQLGSEIVTRFFDLAGMAYDLPGSGEDLFFLRRKSRRVRVEMGGKSPGASDVGFDMKRIVRKVHDGRRTVTQHSTADWLHERRRIRACRRATTFSLSAH